MFDYHLIFWRNIECFNHIFSGVVAEKNWSGGAIWHQLIPKCKHIP